MLLAKRLMGGNVAPICPLGNFEDASLSSGQYKQAAMEGKCWTHNRPNDVDTTTDYGDTTTGGASTGAAVQYNFTGVAGQNYAIEAELRKPGLGYGSVRIYRDASHPLGSYLLAEGTRITDRTTFQTSGPINYTVPSGEGGAFYVSIACEYGGGSAGVEFKNVTLTET
mgnify:CR=1 FL=1